MSSPDSLDTHTPQSFGRGPARAFRFREATEVWNSFGFVEVGEQRGDDGDYPMKRTKSSVFVDSTHEDSLLASFKLLENRILVLQREVTALKGKLEFWEEDTRKTSKWGLKYSRRLTLFTNALLGIWIFARRFIRRIQLKRSKILQNMMTPNSYGEAFNVILYQAYLQAIAKSWYFFIAVICLASETAWKRNTGLTISTCTSLYAIFKSKSSLVHYLSILSTAIYIWVEWASRENKEDSVKTLSDFIGPIDSLVAPPSQLQFN